MIFDNINDEPWTSSKSLRVNPKTSEIIKSRFRTFHFFMFFLFCFFSFWSSFSSFFLYFSFMFSERSFIFSFVIFLSGAKKRKYRRKVPIVKKTMFLSENSIFGPRWTMAGRKAYLRVTSAFIFEFFTLSFFLFFFSFLVLSNEFQLIASVSEFNCRCFLRSRCSMECWCPDDRRRDSRSWVGPPARERA